MKIACICQCRDECDIIELFVRINARVFDHIFIIDNNSADATPQIIKKLIAEGYPITTTFDGDNTYNQDSLTTRALYSINSQGVYDWILPLDTDEFIHEPKDDILAKLEAVPMHMTPKSMWRSWVPTNTNYFEHLNPLYSIFNPLATENHITYKVAVRKEHIPHIKLGHGNHNIYNAQNGQQVPDMDSKIRINHFPVRSPEQITSKVVLGHYRQMVRNFSKKGDTGPVRYFFQLSKIHEELRKSNFLITKEDLRRWAVIYNIEIPPSGNDPQIDSAYLENFGFEDDKIQYPDLARIALGASFDRQMTIQHMVIQKLQRKLEANGIAL